MCWKLLNIVKGFYTQYRSVSDLASWGLYGSLLLDLRLLSYYTALWTYRTMCVSIHTFYKDPLQYIGHCLIALEYLQTVLIDDIFIPHKGIPPLLVDVVFYQRRCPCATFLVDGFSPIILRIMGYVLTHLQDNSHLIHLKSNHQIDGRDIMSKIEFAQEPVRIHVSWGIEIDPIFS
jgi:hypothetical protein